MTQLDLLGSGSPFDAIRHEDDRGEYWLARELMVLMGYARWEDFRSAISRAMVNCANSDQDADQHFEVLRHTPKNPSGGRPSEDFRLTRIACSWVVLNGDPRKPETALAKTYFAIKTREAEVTPARSLRALPQNYAQALRELANTVEELESSKAALAIAAPKATAWDVLVSADGDMDVRRAAFVLNRDPHISTGQNRLFDWLRDARWIDRKNVPYAEHAKHVRLRVYAHEGHTKQQVRITAEGLRLLHRRLGGTAPLSSLMPDEPDDLAA